MDVVPNSQNIASKGKCSKKLPFSSLERELLMALVRERPIIEDKRIHAKNIALKRQAWEDLTIAFNAQPHVTQRNHMQLKRCWENTKSQRKRELSQGNRNMLHKSLRNACSVRSADINFRKKRDSINTEHNKELQQLRIKREKILIERDTNMLRYDKEIHDLKKEKLKLEIELLKNVIL